MDLTPLTYILLVSTLLEFNPLFQTMKSIRNKSVKDVSPLTFTAILIIGALWLFYGITIQSLPLIVGNAIKLFTSITVVVIYFIYRKR
jgi:MtN3 and saliva related transmembrane protein